MLRRCNFKGCNFAFTSKQRLESHKIQDHCLPVTVELHKMEKLGHYICEFNTCNFRSNSINQLRNHRLRVHRIHLYECQRRLCDYQSEDMFSFMRHTKTVHNEIVRPCYEKGCQGKMYKSLINHHKNKHYYNFQCRFCGLELGNFGTFKDHIKDYHLRMFGLDPPKFVNKYYFSQSNKDALLKLWLNPNEEYLINKGYISFYDGKNCKPLGGFENMKCGFQYRNYLGENDEIEEKTLHEAYRNYMREELDKLRSKEKVAPRKDNVSEKQELKDNIYFREDPRLPFLQLTGNAITWLKIDQGHVIPAADFVYDMTLVHDTYKVCNLVPVYRRCNRGLMKQAEILMRDIAANCNSNQVFTLIIYDKDSKVYLSVGNVPVTVPSFFAKLAYIKRVGEPLQALAVLFPNSQDEFSTIFKHFVTIEEIESLTEMKFKKVPMVWEKTTRLRDNLIRNINSGCIKSASISYWRRGNNEFSFLCDVKNCTATFSTYRSKETHMAIIHRRGKVKLCPFPGCNKQFLAKYFLRHYSYHQDTYKCKFCKYPNGRKSFMQQHERVCQSKDKRSKKIIMSIKRTGDVYGFYGNNSTNQVNKRETTEQCVDVLENSADTSKSNKIKYFRPSKACCYVCGLRFNSVSVLAFHYKVNHKGEGAFKCIKCQKVHDTSDALISHFHKAHLYRSCPDCGKLLKGHKTLRMHLACVSKATNKEKICCKELKDSFTTAINQQSIDMFQKRDGYFNCMHENCNFISKTNKNIRKHISSMHSVTYKCKVCQTNCNTYKDFYKHYRSKHKNTQFTLMCDICGDIVTAKLQANLPFSLISHMKHVHGTSKVECSYCGEEFEGNLNLRIHKNEKHRYFTCNICNKKYCEKRSLAIHMERTHDNANIKEQIKKSIETSLKTEMLTLDVVKFNTESRTNSGNKRMKLHSEVNDTDSVSPIKLVTFVSCLICKKLVNETRLGMHNCKKFLNESCLAIHKNLPHNAITDQVNEKLNNTCAQGPAEVSQSQNNTTSMANELKCSTCNYSSDEITDLLSHKTFLHKCIYLQCDKCSLLSIGTLANLLNHKRSTHCVAAVKGTFDVEVNMPTEPKVILDPQTNKYSCVYAGCNQFFNSKIDLRNHISEKHWVTYVCKNCPISSNRYTDIVEFLNHCTIIHSISPKLVQICELCTEAFGTKFLLAQHKKKVHPDPSLTCQLCGNAFTEKFKFKKHLKVMHGNEKLSCKKCGVEVQGKYNMTIHLRNEHYKQECSICGLKCERKSYLKEHMIIAHNRN